MREDGFCVQIDCIHSSLDVLVREAAHDTVLHSIEHAVTRQQQEEGRNPRHGEEGDARTARDRGSGGSGRPYVVSLHQLLAAACEIVTVFFCGKRCVPTPAFALFLGELEVEVAEGPADCKLSINPARK